MTVTAVRNASWVVAWDAASQRQVYRKDVDVVFENDTLLHVGAGYAGREDTTNDGRGLMVMPGLVDIHAHPGHEPAFRGLREEHGVRGQYMTGLFERSQAYGPADAQTQAASTEVACCELLRSGVTSVVDIGPPWDGWAL